MNDGAESASATVTIDVYNNQPQAYDSSETVHRRDTLDAFVDGWDEDSADLEFITFVVESQPANGFVGTDSFQFRVSDGVASDVGDFLVSFQPPANDDPPMPNPVTCQFFGAPVVHATRNELFTDGPEKNGFAECSCAPT